MAGIAREDCCVYGEIRAVVTTATSVRKVHYKVDNELTQWSSIFLATLPGNGLAIFPSRSVRIQR